MPLSATDENGNPVDWWFMYKVAGKSRTSDGSTPAIIDGTEHVYFDANTPENGALTLSSHHVDMDGALPNTLKQVYREEGASTMHLGWFFYNDENPINGKTNSSRGHTKGVLGLNSRRAHR